MKTPPYQVEALLAPPTCCSAQPRTTLVTYELMKKENPMYASFDNLIQQLQTQAKEKGIVEPVFALLSPEVPQARAIYKEFKGQTLESLPDREGMAAVVLLPRAEAARLFRRYAGQGGAVAADILEDRMVVVDYWMAVLAPQALNLLAFRDGKEIHRASLEYDKVGRHIRSLTKLLDDDDVSLLTVHTEDNPKMTGCGPTGGAIALAAALACMALNRHVPVPHQGRIVHLLVGEDQLASFLSEAVNDPKIVAEAIMALKKARRRKREVAQERSLESAGAAGLGRLDEGRGLGAHRQGHRAQQEAPV